MPWMLDPWIAKYWTEDAELQFAGVPVAKGHAEIESFFAERFNDLKMTRHTITNIDVLPDEIYHAATVTYILKDDEEGEEVSVRASTVFGKVPGEGRIRYSHSYMDPSPLVERKMLVAQRKK